ncbi:MAG: heme-binding protein [Thiogranum sp.]
MRMSVSISLAVCAGVLLSSAAFAGSVVVDARLMTLELASKIARVAVASCADAGYQVSAVVVDRSGAPQVVMRDVFASRFTIEIAERKANAVILSGVSSSEFRVNRAGIVAEMNEVNGILVLDGAVPIRTGGALLGAVGVSGAPGGDKDEACARAGVKDVQEQLDFLD